MIVFLHDTEVLNSIFRKQLGLNSLFQDTLEVRSRFSGLGAVRFSSKRSKYPRERFFGSEQKLEKTTPSSETQAGCRLQSGASYTLEYTNYSMAIIRSQGKWYIRT